MQIPTTYILLSGLAISTLLLVFLIGAIDLLTPLWTSQHRAPHHVRYTTGIVMALGVVDCVYWAVVSLAMLDTNVHDVWTRIGESIDMILLLNTFLIGEAILYGKEFTAKRVWLYVIPSVVMAVLNPIINEEWFLYVFAVYALVCVIVQMIRHIKAHARGWIITCMVLLFIMVLGYFTFNQITSAYDVPVNVKLFYYTTHDLVASIVWATILLRIIRYDEKENIALDSSNV